jgi:anti-sigma regulatory factor (Ser/Thr protein kinase)
MSRHSFAVRTGRQAPAAVREALRERALDVPVSVHDDLLLLITEVVTNAVRHSGARTGDPIEIELQERRDCVHVVVTDVGDGFDPPDELVPDHSTTGGLGLVLIDRLARAWGTRRTRRGAVVWFELAYDPARDITPHRYIPAP